MHLLITLGFPPQRGGMQRHLYQRCLLTPGDIVVAAPGRGRSEAWDRAQPFSIWRWPGRPGGVPGWRRLAQTAWALAAIYRAHKHYPIKGIEIGQALPFGIATLWARIRWGLPYRVWAFGDEFIKPATHPLGRVFLKHVLARADAVYAVSRYTATLLRPWVPSPERVFVIHPWPAEMFTPGHREAARARVGLPPGAPVLLTVGRLHRRKGVGHVLRALPLLVTEFPTLHYVVAGSGRPPEEWKRLARALGVHDRVRWMSDVCDEALVAWYRAADVFVLVPTPGPGEVEGFGMVYVEAAGCGIPSVAGVNGGTPEAVLHGKTGLLVFENRPDAIAAAVSTLLHDPEHRDTMGRNAVAYATTLREQTAHLPSILNSLGT